MGGMNMDDIFSGGTSARSPQRASYESSLAISIEEAYHGVKKQVNLSLGGKSSSIEVKVPKGIKEGQKLRVKGERSGIDGDILFEIKFHKDKKLTLDGLDITKKIDILPWEAALGSEVVVDTFEGKIKFKVPEGIESGKKIRIPKKGYRDMKDKKGNLYLEMNIVNPPSLNKRQKELYEELKEITDYKPR